MLENKLSHDQVNQPGPEDKIFFYPKEFYIFDNFTAFQVEYMGHVFPTSEHAYQAMKFIETDLAIFQQVKLASSAHDAQRLATEYKSTRNPHWDEKKHSIMKDILKCKIDQHPYVHKKLLESGDREIIEDSWRDPVWGWGPNKDGQNLLGKLWMELRDEYSREKPL